MKDDYSLPISTSSLRHSFQKVGGMRFLNLRVKGSDSRQSTALSLKCSHIAHIVAFWVPLSWRGKRNRVGGTRSCTSQWMNEAYLVLFLFFVCLFFVVFLGGGSSAWVCYHIFRHSCTIPHRCYRGHSTSSFLSCSQLEEMTHYVRDAFLKNLDQNSWMSDFTKGNARTKVSWSGHTLCIYLHKGELVRAYTMYILTQRWAGQSIHYVYTYTKVSWSGHTLCIYLHKGEVVRAYTMGLHYVYTYTKVSWSEHTLRIYLHKGELVRAYTMYILTQRGAGQSLHYVYTYTKVSWSEHTLCIYLHKGEVVRAYTMYIFTQRWAG